MKRRKFITITLLASTTIILSGCFKQSPGKTVEKFHRSVEEGNIDEAMNLLSASVTKNFGSEKIKLGMSQGVSETKEKGGIKSFTINSEEVTGDVAEVNYTIEYGNGSKESQNIQLIKEDGEWKLSPGK